MQTTLSASDLGAYVQRLLATALPDGRNVKLGDGRLVNRALERVEHCFSRIHMKYYEDAGVTLFNHLNGDHAATFLYFLGNSAWRDDGDEDLATRLFYLNKIMHGVDLFYSVAMPDVFMLVHPIGTVLGKAVYSDYFVVYQQCTVGADGDAYPRFGEGVVLYSGSGVVGNCEVGSNVVFGAHSLVVNTRVPNDTVVVGQYPAHRFVPSRETVRARCFERPAGTAR